jgi:putative transposase
LYNICMPGKNAIKMYVENGYYHIYNRGVEKRTIFQDQQDYDIFLSYLCEYLQPKDEKSLLNNLSAANITSRGKDKILNSLRLNNFDQTITLLAYSLMPNHFHLFVKQKDAGAIDKFMRSLGTRYVKYFNHKHKRVGALFQAVYKAALIDDEAYYLHISRYIHKQAIDVPLNNGRTEQPSSFPEYIGTRKTSWVHPEEILSLFSETDSRFSYQQFVAEYHSLESDQTLYLIE